MSQISKLPKIIVNFVIVGKDFDMHEFSELINITPSETRTPEEWPEFIKNDKNLPDDLKPRFEWSLIEEFESCMEIEGPLFQIVDKLKGKESIIANYYDNNNLTLALVIIIYAKKSCYPALVIPKEIVSFFGNIGTEISFDLYYL